MMIPGEIKNGGSWIFNDGFVVLCDSCGYFVYAILCGIIDILCVRLVVYGVIELEEKVSIFDLM